MNNQKISVCVPTYNRPETLYHLISSYKKQTYKHKELIISDDTPDNSIQEVVEKLNDGTIRYFHNVPSIGFPRNFLESLLRGSGSYRLTIGDDDIFASEVALERYVETFNENPNVGFAYSNQYQFNNKLEVEYKITKFARDTLFSAGEHAIKNLLIHSIFISGQAFRGDTDFRSLYPQVDILHPQVQLVGNILAQKDGVGLCEYAIGVRSHQDQIIFRALKNESIKRQGKHMNIELLEIFRALKKRWGWEFTENFLVRQLIENYPSAMIKERIVLGKEAVRQYYSDFCNQSAIVGQSIKLRMLMFVCQYAPTMFVTLIRFTVIAVVKTWYFRSYKRVAKNLRELIL